MADTGASAPECSKPPGVPLNPKKCTYPTCGYVIGVCGMPENWAKEDGDE